MSSNASIRGVSAQLKFFQDGGDLDVINVNSFEVNQQSTFMKSFYVGQKFPVGDQSMEGWEGSCEIEVTDDRIDRIMDALINNNLAGVGVSEYSMLHSETYPDGQVASYVYGDMQFRLDRRVPGQNQKVTLRLSFQAMVRTRL